MQADSSFDAEARLRRLSAKEREVLDHILQHKPLKMIAHDLGITLSAVDQRLKSARQKLGALDRNDAARAYAALLAACRKSPCGFEVMESERNTPLSLPLEPPSGSVFMLQDSGVIDIPPPWMEHRQGRLVPEVLDDRFGRLWRILAIPVFAIIIAMLALALMAMAKALGDLL